jgi:KDO2-lipid IV(A) lauroyltransferase
MGSPDWLKRLDYGLLLPLAGKLPFSLAQKMANFRGWIHYHSGRDSRNHATNSVSSIFPELNEREVKKIVVGHYQTPSRDEVEAFWYQHSFDCLSRFTKVSGFEMLKEAAESGSGVLLFSGHLGSTGLFFSFIGKSGIPMNIVGRSIDPEENPLHRSEWAFNKKRVRWIEEAVGNPFLLTGKGNYSSMLEKLHAGEVLMLLIDVLPTLTKRHVPVRFFGSTARFADGIASLFRESNARLIHYMIRWDQESKTHSIELTELTDSVSRSASNAVIMQTLIDQVEERIRRYPGHWWCWDSLAHYYPQEEL